MRGVTDAKFVMQRAFVGVGPRSSGGHQKLQRNRKENAQILWPMFLVFGWICRSLVEALGFPLEDRRFAQEELCLVFLREN